MILLVQEVACASSKSVQQTQCEALATWEKLNDAQADNYSLRKLMNREVMTDFDLIKPDEAVS